MIFVITSAMREGLVTILALAVDVQDQGSLHGGEAQHGEAFQIVWIFAAVIIIVEPTFSLNSTALNE